MIGLDTNVLIRLFTADDERQMLAARRFVDRECTEASPGYISCVVLAELVWVLARAYRYSRPQIADVVAALLAGRDRMIEYHDEVGAALNDFRSSGADFVDCLVGRLHRANGCAATATFDRKAARLAGFVRVG
jgi:predicted nucleic-acid-binding protein